MATGRELVRNKKAKASIWGHFRLIKEGGVVKENVARCDICHQEVKYAGGTSNLSAHVRRHHPDVNVEGACSVSDPVKKPIQHSQCLSTSSTTTTVSQPTLTSFISGQTKYPAKSMRALSITNQIGRFLVKDLRPYSMVENCEFRKLINLLDPRYTVPGRKQFSEVVIPKMYEQEVTKLKDKLCTSVKVALTSDGWTSRSTESFVTITCSFIDSDWELQNYVLQTRPLPENHTGENISAVLREAVAEWSLSADPYPPIVTDNASNMERAGEIFGTEMHVKCYAHTLNLAVQKALKVQRVSTILARIRRIVSFFHRSCVAAANLKTQCELLSIPYHKLIIDVPTRWNSAFDMLQRFLEMQFAVTAVLRSKAVSKIKERDISSLSDDDLLFAEDVMTTLKPMKTITTSLCTERIPTLSVIQPLQHSVKMLMSPTADDKPAIKELKSAILKDINERYSHQSDFLNKVSFMDPRFKSLPFLEEQCKLEVYADVTKSIAIPRPFTVKQEPEEDRFVPALPNLPSPPQKEQIDVATDKNNNSPGRKKPKKSESGLASLFNEVYVTGVDPPSEEEPSLMQIAETEVNRYRSMKQITCDENPLTWWKDNSESLPLLSHYAKTVLCIPATSVPSERVFSTAGDVVSGQRATLKSQHVDKLIFLKENME